jgi:hypothetical protein
MLPRLPISKPAFKRLVTRDEGSEFVMRTVLARSITPFADAVAGQILADVPNLPASDRRSRARLTWAGKDRGDLFDGGPAKFHAINAC